jgi:hypothetical protein
VGERQHRAGFDLSVRASNEMKFDDKLHKLITCAKKQRGMLWPSVVSKLSSHARTCDR